MPTMRFHMRSLRLLPAICAMVMLLACAGKEAVPTGATPRAAATPVETTPADQTTTSTSVAHTQLDQMALRDQMSAEAEKVTPDQPTYLAKKVAVHPEDTLIPLTADVVHELDPSSRFSLGLDVYARQDFQPLNHKRVLVATSRLAIDSEGRHLLQSLMPSRKPMVRKVIFFNDELPAPARTSELDRILAAYPDVRVFERTPRNFRLTETMFEDIDVVLIDLPLRGAQFYPENGFLAGLLQDAALHNLQIVVLDRPTPTSGLVVDGPVFDQRLYGSVTAFYPMIMMMGLTTGEVATLINSQYGLGAKLEVIRMQSWHRDAGYSLLWQAYDRLQINPGLMYEEWNHYIPRMTLSSQLQAIADALPSGKVIAVEAAPDGSARLVIDPAPLAPQQFVDNLKQYQVANLSAAPGEASADSAKPIVTLSSTGILPEPAYAAVALWAVWAKADPAVLPEEGRPGLFGTTLVFDGLRAGRHPRDLQRTWTSQATFAELDNRRKRSLIY